MLERDMEHAAHRVMRMLWRNPNTRPYVKMAMKKAAGVMRLVAARAIKMTPVVTRVVQSRLRFAAKMLTLRARVAEAVIKHKAAEGARELKQTARDLVRMANRLGRRRVYILKKK